MLNNSTTFIGLDLGDKYSYLTILDQDAEVIEETRLPTSKSAFRESSPAFLRAGLPWKSAHNPAGLAIFSVN